TVAAIPHEIDRELAAIWTPEQIGKREDPPTRTRFFDDRARKPPQVVFIVEAHRELPFDRSFRTQPVIRYFGELGQPMLRLSGRHNSESDAVTLGATQNLPVQFSGVA